MRVGSAMTCVLAVFSGVMWAPSRKGFVVLEQDVAVDQLHLTLAQALYFPAGQGDAGFEALLDEIVVFGLFCSAQWCRCWPGNFFCLLIGASVYL